MIGQRALISPLLGLMFLATSITSSAVAADRPAYFAHQSISRQTILHEPRGLPPGMAPLVIALHGSRQTVRDLRQWIDLDAIAGRHQFRVAYPIAINRLWTYGRRINTPMQSIRGEPVDDVGFVSAMIDRFIEHGIADPERVYVVGVSRGGMLANALACALGDKIAGFAVLLASMTDHQLGDCAAPRPRPMLILAGTEDQIIPYDGWRRPFGRILSIPETTAFWRRAHGCRAPSRSTLRDLDPNDGTTVDQIDWHDCQSGQVLRLYRVNGGGHELPSFIPLVDTRERDLGRRSRDMDTAEAVWKFFARAQR